MSIVGVGLEWVDVERLLALDLRYGDRFRSRLFTEVEADYAARFTSQDRSSQALAGAFAAKVAARRALDCAPGREAGWQEIEVRRRRDGPPSLAFSGQASDRAKELGVKEVWLTLTHDGPHCIGHVILEGSR